MLSRFEFYLPSSDGGSRIHGMHWLPESEPIAAVQICHGMLEHIGRYDGFAREMSRNGIAVVGHDQLGHGKTALPGRLGIFAKENGAAFLLKDIERIQGYVKRQHARVPHFLLGHSMGSFLARRFLTLPEAKTDGAILMGAGSKSPVKLWIGTQAVNRAVRREGRDYYNPRLHRLVLGAYNRRFEPGESGHEWLSRDGKENRAYEADPYCQFIFSNGAYEDFFQIMNDLKRRVQFDQIPKNLPILLLSGAEDPVGDGGRGVKRIYREYRSQGLSDVEMKLYSGARHELLNEINRGEVYQDITRWILRQAASSPAYRNLHSISEVASGMNSNEQ